MKKREELDIELANLKKKFGKVYEVDVILDDATDEDGNPANTATVFFKHPDRVSYSQISKFLSADTIKSIEIFVKGNYIGGEDLNSFVSNDYALRSLDNALAEILYVKQSSLKKN